MDNIDEAGYTAWYEFRKHVQGSMGRTMKQNETYFSSRHYNSYRKIGELCLTHGFEIPDFIRAAISSVDKQQRYIQPYDLLNATLIKNYKDDLKEHGAYYERDWLRQVMLLQQQAALNIPKFYESEESILSSDMLQFESYFRVLHLTPFNENLYNKFGTEAWQYLSSHPDTAKFIQRVYRNNVEILEKRLGALALL